jgi:hypothetical protein
VSKTKTLLRAAEVRVGDALDLPDLREALKKLSPDQSFRFLSEFYGFSISFGMPGYPEYELLDGWHRPLRFSFDGNKAVVWSIGADAVNQFGSGDDIKSTIELKSAKELGQ